MELNLLRHAESKFNKIGLLQGRIDCNLSEEGIRKTKERAKNNANYMMNNNARRNQNESNNCMW